MDTERPHDDAPLSGKIFAVVERLLGKTDLERVITLSEADRKATGVESISILQHDLKSRLIVVERVKPIDVALDQVGFFVSSDSYDIGVAAVSEVFDKQEAQSMYLYQVQEAEWESLLSNLESDEFSADAEGDAALHFLERITDFLFETTRVAGNSDEVSRMRRRYLAKHGERMQRERQDFVASATFGLSDDEATRYEIALRALSEGHIEKEKAYRTALERARPRIDTATEYLKGKMADAADDDVKTTLLELLQLCEEYPKDLNE